MPRPDEPARPLETTAVSATQATPLPTSDAGSDALPLRDRQRYKFIEQHASGGLGRIWRVRDRELGRELALKELLTPSPDLTRRFTREALTTARLEHPSIVPVHDAGRTEDGEHFYTMKLVAGTTLTQLVAPSTTLAQRLALLPRVLAVAEAVAYAHSKGVLHRDLKPDNVLVGDFGETVVIDWGLAKPLNEQQREASPEPASSDEGAELTRVGAVMGTPAFMPPEQANAGGVDERADVYALGAILYFVLTCVPPFKGKTTQEVLTAVRAGPPTPVRTRCPEVPEDLASVVARAMAREKDQRYPSARAFADDLSRFLTRQLVTSHRYSAWERLGRMLQKHRAVVVSAVVAVLLLGVGAVVAGLRESLLRRDAERSTLALLEEQGRSELQSGHPLRASVYLAEALRRSPKSLALRHLLTQAMRPVASKRLDLVGHHKDVVSAKYSPDGKHLVTGSTDKTVRLWDARSGALVHVLGPHDGGLDWVAFSPDGQRVATGALDKKVRVFRVDSGEAVLSFEDPNPYRVAFTPDGQRFIVAGQNGEARVRDASTGALIATLSQHTDRIAAITFSPDASELYLGSWDKTVSVWRLSDHRRTALMGPFEAEVSDISLSEDGAWAAIAESDANIHLYQRDGWKKSHSVRTPEGARWPNVELTQGGQVLLVRTHDARLRAYHTSSGQLLTVVDVWPEGKLFGSALSPSHDELAVIGLHGNVAIWSLAGVFDFQVLPLGVAYRQSVFPSLYAPEHDLIATPTQSGQLFLWNARAGTQRAAFEVGPTPFALAWGPNARTLFLTNFKRPVRLAALIDLATGTRLGEIPHPSLVPDVAGTRDGNRFATAGYDGKVRVVAGEGLDVIAEHALDPERISSLAWHPDGTELAASNEYGKLSFVDAASGRVKRTFDAHSTWVQDMEYFADGTHLVTAGRQDHQVRVWDLATGRRVYNFAHHQNNVMDVSVSDDGRLLASAALDHRAHLYDLKTGQLLRSFTGPGYTAQLSRDGKRLLTTGYNGYAVVWNVEPDVRPVEQLVAEVAARSPWKLVDAQLEQKGN